MALSILQFPATASLAQSPMMFSLSSSTDTTQSSFQYTAELWYWSGGVADSGSSKYTLVKYPNSSGVGLFDVSRIVNSTLTDLAIANTSNVKYYKCRFGTQWVSSSLIVTGSTKTDSGVYKALDGYAIFQESIGQQIGNKTPYWPIMTDGPATQSVFENNIGSASVYVGNVSGSQPTSLFYSSSIGTATLTLPTASGVTSTEIAQFPMFPSASGFPLSTIGLTDYTIQPKSGSTLIGSPIRFEVTCEQKYPNIRIKWKNRFGQFDWMNFYGVSQNGMSVDRQVYQPQIGSWDSSTLSYNNYDAQTKPYVVNARQTLLVNSQIIPESYNDIFKELLVSDEIYWIYNESNNDIRPIAINQNSITFQTGVVNKTIQYSFTFDWAQNYKLII
jgi:hypothetical protein